MIRAALLCLPLAACTALPPPNVAADPAALSGPPPRIAPLDPLLAAADRPVRAEAAGAALAARRAGLRTRAARLGPAPVSDALAARGDRLRARAAALRTLPL